MLKFYLFEVLLAILYANLAFAYNINPSYDCGPYGFTCERNNRVRLCDETKLIGPAFVCPFGTFCNEESTSVCEDAINHIDPAMTKRIRCHRNERITNPSVPGCKGYILCVPNGSRFQAINFRCSGNTIFSGISRTCTSPSKYKCPLGNSTKTEPQLFSDSRRPGDGANKLSPSGINPVGQRPTSIECKNYKFRVTQDDSPSQTTYFCPPRPARGQDTIRCTIFSNYFCITLDRDDEDQYIVDNTPYRRPRM